MGLRIAIISLLCAGLVMGAMMPSAQAAGLALDQKVTKKQTSASSSITTPKFSTAVGNELFLAFVAVDGPGGSGTQTISSVTGAGLTWTLRKRANAPGTGTSEIWQAVATTPKSNVTVKATMSSGSYAGQLTVATFTGASLTQNGAVAGASAPNGAASLNLTTTRQNSWVWGVGNDWDRAAARTLGVNQTMVDETVNTTIGDTQWVQRQNNLTPAAGTVVTLNTAAPTNDKWNFVAIEIPNATADSTPPVAPVVGTPVHGTSGSDATPTFAGTGEVGATLNLVIDTTSPVTTVVDGAGNWAYTPTLTLADGVHTVRATQVDAVGNVSPVSTTSSFTVDTTAPGVTVNQKAGQADPTPSDSAAFTIAFSEAVNTGTVTAGDVIVNGTTGTVTSLSQISATTWEATVNGMTSGDTAVVTVDANSATDLVGNGNQASTSTDNSVTFDDTIVAAPSITSPTNNMRLSNPSPAIAGTGVDGTVVTLRVDGSTVPCLEGIVVVSSTTWLCTPVNPLAEGGRVLAATQTNALSHESSISNEVNIIVDTVQPNLTVNQKAGQADPTSVNSAAYSAVFSEEIDASTLAKEDFSVSGSTGIVTALTQVDATTWEATVTGMTSGDTAVLTMSENKVADLAGNVNQASTSTDNSVQYTAPTSIIGWQLTSANTGLAPHGLTCDSLPEYTGPAKVPAGTTISQMKITKSLILAEGGVTIERSCFKPTASDYTMAQTYDNDACTNDGCLPPPSLSTIRDSEFNGSALDVNPNDTYNRAHVTAFKGVATLQRNYVHNVGSGMGILASGTQLDALVEQNYVTGLKSWGNGATDGTHSEAFTIRDFDGTQRPARTGTVRNNRFNVDGGNETGALFIQAMGNVNNVTIEGNLMEGDGYQLQLMIWDWASPGTHYSNMKAINNRFSGTGYGASSVQSGTGWAVWQNNYYNNVNAANNQGAPALP